MTVTNISPLKITAKTKVLLEFDSEITDVRIRGLALTSSGHRG